MSGIRKTALIIGLSILTLVLIATALPDRPHIAPESFEVTYILACAQELRINGLRQSDSELKACVGAPANYKILGSSSFAVIGSEFGQSAHFEVIDEAGQEGIRCYQASSKYFPDSCARH